MSTSSGMEDQAISAPTSGATTTHHHGKRTLLAASGATNLNASRTDKNGAPLSEKKLRRLEKNRLSARECRRRKREATEHMQRQINLLEGENLRLRLQLQVRPLGFYLFSWQFFSFLDVVVVAPYLILFCTCNIMFLL